MYLSSNVHLIPSVLTRDQLHPHLKEYVQKFGSKDYHGGPMEVDILFKNIETITFYDDTTINGHHHKEVTVRKLVLTQEF